MRDSELRGIILEALYNQRRRDLVDFETELGKLSLPGGVVESLLRQLEKRALIERSLRSVSGLGKGRITAYGIEVVERTTNPPLSILFRQNITVEDSSEVRIDSGKIPHVSDIKEMNSPINHSQASEDAPTSLFKRIGKLVTGILKKI
jgi:hypothetical protein